MPAQRESVLAQVRNCTRVDSSDESVWLCDRLLAHNHLRKTPELPQVHAYLCVKLWRPAARSMPFSCSTGLPGRAPSAAGRDAYAAVFRRTVGDVPWPGHGGI